MPGGARIRGLKQLDRALGKADKNLRTKLRGKLRDIASGVATEARQIAESKGLRDSGDLIRGIKPYALTGRAGVRSGAVHRGYNYPRRLEFESRGGDLYGPRASLYPAYDAQRGEVMRATEGLLDGIQRDLSQESPNG